MLVNGLHAKSGGGVTYLANLVPRLAARPDLDLHLLVGADHAARVPAENLTLHTLDGASGFWRLLWREQAAVPRLARRIGARVTFSPANFGPFLAPGGVIVLRNALQVGMVERRPGKVAYWLLLTLATGLALATCRRAIAVSDYARRALGGGLLGFARGKVRVVPHGVADLFSPGDPPPPRGDFVLAVSDIYVQKNFPALVRAIAPVLRARPGLELRIAGRALDPGHMAALRSLVAARGLADRVRFLGHVAPADLVDLYRTCRLFVFPSLVETFGNPLVEAMACGAPIAASRAAAMPEVLGDAAAFFDPRSEADMGAVLEALLDDDARRADLSARALARARDFSWDATAEATARVIREAAGAF
ncbi:MAG: glycosyltransferase family 4 protein [Hyphomicrobiales bacterium]|nr:glycosyltransferase family 4 protein [Hyphomicrobiales bacterium]